MPSKLTFKLKELLALQSVLAFLLSLGAAYLTTWLQPNLPSAQSWLFFGLHVALIIIAVSLAFTLLMSLYRRHSRWIIAAYLGVFVLGLAGTAGSVWLLNHMVIHLLDEQASAPLLRLYGIYAIMAVLFGLGVAELTNVRRHLAEFLECRRDFLEERSPSAS